MHKTLTLSTFFAPLVCPGYAVSFGKSSKIGVTWVSGNEMNELCCVHKNALQACTGFFLQFFPHFFVNMKNENAAFCLFFFALKSS